MADLDPPYDSTEFDHKILGFDKYHDLNLSSKEIVGLHKLSGRYVCITMSISIICNNYTLAYLDGECDY